ncbi:MAG: hypothetical protein JSR41_09875 [Proteobacteria bacterium]|nr:hypothetical protein [Pseudomonadota bacterium]
MNILAWALITIVALACTLFMLLAVALAAGVGHEDSQTNAREGAGPREVLHGLRTIGIVALRIVGVIAALVALASVIVGGLPQ